MRLLPQDSDLRLLGDQQLLHNLQPPLEMLSDFPRRPGQVYRHQREKEIIRTSHSLARCLALHCMSQNGRHQDSQDEAALLNLRDARM
jgi:hypothetical protein